MRHRTARPATARPCASSRAAGKKSPSRTSPPEPGRFPHGSITTPWRGKRTVLPMEDMVPTTPQELADLEDALALAPYRARQASGETAGVPHDDVRARLGLERG